jgi:hypothetical protein
MLCVLTLVPMVYYNWNPLITHISMETYLISMGFVVVASILNKLLINL